MTHEPLPQITLRAISSMATKLILADLTKAYEAQTGVRVEVESVGGVDAAKRITAGETFDLVLLASDAIDRLIASGSVIADSRRDWVKSPVAVAVKQGAQKPDISSEAALKNAIESATSISYSTGPSGVYLEKLFTRWGIMESLKPRIITPPPGIPCGSLVAKGEVAIAFQQLAELIHIQGIDVLGTLPEDCAFITTFSSGVCAVIASDQARTQAVRDFQAFLTSAEIEQIKRKQGMVWGSGLN